MASGDLPTFGALLRRYRLARGLSQEALAERAQLSAFTISALERGASHSPRKDTLDLLAGALSLPAQDRVTLEAAARPGEQVRRPLAGTPPLVGRGRELALLAAQLAGEGPPVLLLAGQPGIGKSRLLQEAAQRARTVGWEVLIGGCQRRGGQQPYAPLLEALGRYFPRQAPPRLRSALRGCAWLVRLLPELAGGPIEPLPTWILPPDQERRLVFAAVARCLANVAGPSGTLLLLDDLQWAGADALDLLATLVRDAAEVPLRVVGAYRDSEVRQRDPLSGVLADLAHTGLAAHRTLGPLTAQAAAELFDRLLGDATEAGPALREQVVERAGGVPFFLVSYARGLQRDGLDGTTQAMPWDLRQSIRQRVAALPEPAPEVLGVAAVLGRTAPRAVLAAAAEQPEPAVLVGLEAACRAQLLEETGEDAYRFVHDVIREVVEADLGLARRTVLHRRVAHALEQQPGELPVEALAYHWARSGDREKAVAYLEQAGGRAQAQGAHAAAEGYYRDLVGRLDGLARVLDAARAREKLGAVLKALARYDAARAVLARAAETYRARGDLEAEGRGAALIGQVHVEAGTPEQGLSLVQPLVVRLAAGGPSPALAALHMARTDLYRHSSRFDAALEAAEQAAAVARALHDARLLAAAHGARGSALETMGRIQEGLGALREALRLAESTGELGSPSGIEMLYHASSASFFSGQLADALRYIEPALSAAERLGDPRYTAWIRGHRGVTHMLLGDWEAARTDLEQAVASHRQLGVASRSATAIQNLGTLHYLQGAWEEAARELEEASAIGEHGGDLIVLLASQGILAEIEIRQGQPAAARARLLPLLDHQNIRRQHLHLVLPGLARACLELGETSEADDLVRQIAGYAREAGELFLLGQVLGLQALVASRLGRWEEATTAVKEGIALARSMPCPGLEAGSLHTSGLLFLQNGEPEPARERLEAALAIFRRLGARKDAEQVERTLAGLAQP